LSIFFLLFHSDFLSKGIYRQTSSEIDTILTLWWNKLCTHTHTHTHTHYSTTLLFVGIEHNYITDKPIGVVVRELPAHSRLTLAVHDATQ